MMNEKNELILHLRNKRLNCDVYNRETLHNSCEKLGEELYSTKTHFFYEIIQNAEDNQYDAAAEPYIHFSISHKRILIQNNELGFKKEDVEPISLLSSLEFIIRFFLPLNEIEDKINE